MIDGATFVVIPFRPQLLREDPDPVGNDPFPLGKGPNKSNGSNIRIYPLLYRQLTKAVPF